MSVTNSNFTLVIFKHASNASPGVVTKNAGSNSYSFKHRSLKSQRYQLIVEHLIEHIEHDIQLDFLF